MKHLKLKSLRALHQLTQSEVANELGITIGTYHLKENGKVNFNMEEIEKLKKLFNMTYEDIFFADSVQKIGTDTKVKEG